MPTWLAIVIVVLVLLVVVLAVGGAIGRQRQLERTRGRFAADLVAGEPRPRRRPRRGPRLGARGARRRRARDLRRRSAARRRTSSSWSRSSIARGRTTTRRSSRSGPSGSRSGAAAANGSSKPERLSGMRQLLTPVDLGPVKLANRVVSTSHQTGLVHDHLPTEDMRAYHVARARGGVGAIFLEATAVDPTGLLTSHTLGGFLPEIVPAYARARRRGRRARHAPVRAALPRRPRADLLRAARARRRAVGGPLAALQERAARADARPSCAR